MCYSTRAPSSLEPRNVKLRIELIDKYEQREQRKEGWFCCLLRKRKELGTAVEIELGEIDGAEDWSR